MSNVSVTNEIVAARFLFPLRHNNFDMRDKGFWSSIPGPQIGPVGNRSPSQMTGLAELFGMHAPR
jgi:hypothetical protein